MKNDNLSTTRRKEQLIFDDVKRHSDTGFQETEHRATGHGRIGSISFDEADELFRSWIDEANWPYDALLFDPRVFTFLFEKTSRLLARKPRGKLVPREGSDVLAAKVNNILLDYQWDLANHGGTMLQKWGLMDLNARKYGAAFSLSKWRYELDPKGNVVFDGPEMEVVNNRDFAHDLTATSIENANWVQVRQYITLQELERVNDQARFAPIYKNLDVLREAIGREPRDGGGGDTRGSNWQSRNRAISRIEVDPYGKDRVYKTVEVVTEYRRDRWITFAPRHGVVLRDVPNPYDNYEIPVSMLRYYVIDDDLYGLSEIEPVKGLQKAINALLCQYVDEINQNLYSPIAIGPGVRQHTLEWGKGARWIMNNPMTDFRIVEGKSNAAAYFNSTYSVLVAAMLNALGESSLGVSNVQPMQGDKTATEVKALQVQRNARDNYNQIMLSEAMKRQMKLWHTMNKKLLFSGEKEKNYIIRVVGRDALDYFKKRGLGEMALPDEAAILMKEQAQLLGVNEQALGDYGVDMKKMLFPKYPVNRGTEGKPKIGSKVTFDEGDSSAELAIEPQDLEGMFDFSVDVESMAVNADDDRRNARQMAVQMIATNPNVGQLLAQDQVKPKFKDLLVSWLDDLGFMDAEKYFEKIEAPVAPAGAPGGGGANSPAGGPAGPISQAMGQEGVANEPNSMLSGNGVVSQLSNTPNINPPNPEMLNRMLTGTPS